MVFGEAGPESIVEIDGAQVLLLWPPIMQSRGWNAGFFGPLIVAAPPAVEVIEELAAEEVQRWRERLQLPEAKKKRWWRR